MTPDPTQTPKPSEALKRRAPAFLFYVDDFLAGTLDMSQEDVGAYIRLLCYQWNRGSIPVEPEKQQRLAGGSVSVDVLAKFRLQPDGRLVNERLERERQRNDRFREFQAEKGRKSAEARKNQPKPNHGSTAVQPDTQPNGQPDTQPKSNLPSPSPSPDKDKAQSAPPLSLILEDQAHPFHLAFGIVLPENLQTLPCLEAVRTWLQYKKERRKAYKPIGLSATLTKWSREFTSATLPAAIEHSIASGWEGVFPPNQPQKPSPKPKRDLAAMTEEEKKAILREAMR